MADGQIATLVRHLRRMVGGRPAADQSDGQLLERFVLEQEQPAFTALVQRHGPMVLGLCRRVVQDADEADDVFQATFLVLARKARSLQQYGSLGNWLYTVAYHLALKTRARGVRRRSVERQVVDVPETVEVGAGMWTDLRPLLDAELDRLPVKYRTPVVLCYLEGKTNEEAARELGWPIGTVKIRLARARDLLKDRLTRRGMALSAGLLTAQLAEEASAAVSASLLESTTEAAALFAAGNTVAAAAASDRAVLIAQGALRAMTMNKLQSGMLLLLTLGLLGAGTGVVMSYASDPRVAMPAVGERVAVEPPKEEEKVPAPAANKEDKKQPFRSPQQALAQRINLDKGIDPNTPLKDALEFLADRFDLTIIIDTKAFAAIGLNRVEDQVVGLPKMVGVSLATVLDLMLGQVEGNGHHATFALRKDHIAVITTAQMFSADRVTTEERNQQPKLHAEFERTSLDAALREVSERTGTSILLDPQLGDKGRKPVTAQFAHTPVDTAVRLLADMADLKAVAIDNVIYVTSTEKGKQLQSEEDARTARRRAADKEAREAKERATAKEEAHRKAEAPKVKPATK